MDNISSRFDENSLEDALEDWAFDRVEIVVDIFGVLHFFEGEFVSQHFIKS